MEEIWHSFKTEQSSDRTYEELKPVLQNGGQHIALESSDRTYEELKLCLREKGGESMPTF